MFSIENVLIQIMMKSMELNLLLLATDTESCDRFSPQNRLVWLRQGFFISRGYVARKRGFGSAIISFGKRKNDSGHIGLIYLCIKRHCRFKNKYLCV